MEKKLLKISYILQFFDSARLMSGSLSDLAKTFKKEFVKINRYTDTMIKNVKLVELHTKPVNIFLNTQTLN